MRYIPLSYESAIRLVFFAERPPALAFEAPVETAVLHYLPPAVDVNADALDTIDLAPLGETEGLRACAAILRGRGHEVLKRFPPERPFIAGIYKRLPGGVGTLAPLDPAVVKNDEAELVYVPPPMGEAIARMRRKERPSPDLFGGHEILDPEEAERSLVEWAAFSATRVDNLGRVWAMDQQEDGPHQPWSRTRARFLMALCSAGVRAPALELLPQWDMQWWYGAIGYRQPSPAVRPMPTRCWSFPLRNGEPQVCGRELATIGTDRPNDAITCMDRHDCQLAQHLRSALHPDDITRRAPRPDFTGARASAIGELLGRIGIGDVERAELLERIAKVMEADERAWKMALEPNCDTEALGKIVAPLARDAAHFALVLKRILAS